MPFNLTVSFMLYMLGAVNHDMIYHLLLAVHALNKLHY